MGTMRKGECHPSASPLGTSPEKERKGTAASRLHLAFGHVGVLVVFKGDAEYLVGHHAVLLDHLAHIDVLDRVVVRPELEVAAGRLEIGLRERSTEGVLVLNAGFFERRQDQVGCVEALASIE